MKSKNRNKASKLTIRVKIDKTWLDFIKAPAKGWQSILKAEAVLILKIIYLPYVKKSLAEILTSTLSNYSTTANFAKIIVKVSKLKLPSANVA